MIEIPSFPQCQCEMHPRGASKSRALTRALDDPFAFIPSPVEFTDEMAVIANRYWAGDIDWRYYPAFQAAAFLQPKTAEKHVKRRSEFLALKETAESQGFVVPDALTRLFTTDDYIDRLHHNCVWPSLPQQIVRLPSHPDFAVLLFLVEGQGCGQWHLLLAPGGSHSIINADDGFGRDISGFVRDPATIQIFQCMDHLNRLLYYYFIESGRHDRQYVKRLKQYFAENGKA